MLFNITEQEYLVAEPEHIPTEPEHYCTKAYNNYKINWLLRDPKL